MRAWIVLSPLSTRLPRRARHAATREVLAASLRAAGELAGAPRALPFEAWPSDAAGAPAEVLGWHASWTDTTGLLAAVVAPFEIALDAEWCLRPRWEAAREHFRASGELALLAQDGREAVLALWCAKEALLKRARVGLADLGRCPLVARNGGEAAGDYSLNHRGAEHLVRVRAVGQHLLAVAGPAELELELRELQEVG